MNVISIDPSKYSTGIFTKIDGQENSFVILNKKGCSQEEALKNIYQVFTSILKKEKYHFGLIEGYGFNFKSKNIRSVIPMSEVGGVIKLIFAQAEIPLITVPVQTWRTLTIGRINKKSKDNYLAAISIKYGCNFSTTDESDAFLIYQAVKEMAKRTKRLTPGMIKIKKQLQKIIEERNNKIKFYIL